ncbi:MAG: VIT and VWA domain-containing protein [Puniceicoccales bacterium]|nr:VIT and VWA domain-containing protein [Puniceicoccales bacterium]
MNRQHNTTTTTSIGRIGLETWHGPAPVLQGVRVRGRLDGLLLETSVRQQYRNTGERDIEAVYTFPLASGARLTGMDVTLGGKRLSGAVIQNQEARQRYEDAIDVGDSPVLVNQTGTGLHTANLGNLRPGEDATLEVRYAQLLCHEQGRVRLVLPTVVAPRYGDAHAQGKLAAHETTDPDLAAHYPLELEIELAGEVAAATSVTSPTHAISVGANDDGTGRIVKLAPDAALDRDFVLVLDGLAGKSFAILTPEPSPEGSPETPGAAGNRCAMLASFHPELPVSREPLFLKILLDCSGSMAGDSIRAARVALHAIFAELNPADHVSFSRFGDSVEHTDNAVLPATPRNLKRLAASATRADADLGGTEMRAALLSVFNDVACPSDATGAPAPSVLLITDGEVWDVAAILASARKSGHRVFAVGIGSAPAENLLRTLAEQTGGACEFATPNEDAAAAIVRMFRRMRSVGAGEVRVDWGVKPLWQSTLPKRVYGSETLHVFAQFETPPQRPPCLRWNIDGTGHCLAATTLRTAPAAPPPGPTITRLAGARRMDETPDSAIRTALALRYQLVSEHTSLFLVHVRESGDKAGTLPALRQVSQMLAVGWGGTGSVLNLFADMDRMVRHDGPSKWRVPACKAPLPPPPPSCKKRAVSSPLPAAAPDAVRVLERFDAIVLQGNDFAGAIAILKKDGGEIGKRVEQLESMLKLPNGQIWAVLLHWLAKQRKADFTPSPQAARLLRHEVGKIAPEICKTIEACLPGCF